MLFVPKIEKKSAQAVFAWGCIALLLLVVTWVAFSIHCGDTLHAVSGKPLCGVATSPHTLAHIGIFSSAFSAAVVALAFFALQALGILLRMCVFYARPPLSQTYERAAIPRTQLSAAFSRGIIERKEDPFDIHRSR